MFRKIVFIVPLLFVACAQPYKVVKPEYPSALIQDSVNSFDSGRAAFFVLSALDGEPVQVTSLNRSGAPFGTGRNMHVRSAERYVAAGQHRLTLKAQFGVAAPIEFLMRPSSFWKVSGDIVVELKPDTTYQIVGNLDEFRREIWLEESSSGTVVGPKIVNAEIAQVAEKEMAGAAYTCCNLHYQGDWISDTNETTLPMIPAGSRIALRDYGRHRASVLIDAKAMRIGHDYGRKEETNEAYVGKLMVKDDPKIRIKTFDPKVQEAIAAGKVRLGMSREQVIIALGYPRTDITPSLDKREWQYWTAGWEEFQVLWGNDGLVSQIRGEPSVLGQVSLP